MSIENTEADASVDAHVGDHESSSSDPSAASIDTLKSTSANVKSETSRDSDVNKDSRIENIDDAADISNTSDNEDPRIGRTDEIENLRSYDPFAEADDDTGERQGAHQYLHIRIQQRNKRKTLTTVQGIPHKFEPKKILKVLRKTFACNGTIVNDPEMGQVIQLQGDQRKCVLAFLIDKDEGLALDERNIKIHGF